MPITPAIGIEPIPGYLLTEKLGAGGYGEVWKVLAPGGIGKAIKIIYGDMTGPQAEQELKALERIKSVRHPFLLSLERFEVLGGQLLIITELADKSLLQRFRECRSAGLAGIPREELLDYLRNAANALDYLNETHGLQHLDIKPENLLLISGHVKVGDFGLVKHLGGQSASITGGVTPVYAPPEAFDGRVSRFSDQYSLAIVYQEMLTGVRPFPGTTAFQLAAQHSTAPPMLDALPVEDRPRVARALSKIPEQRFPRCRDLIESLRERPASATSSTSTQAAVARDQSTPSTQKYLGMETLVPAQTVVGPLSEQTGVAPSHLLSAPALAAEADPERPTHRARGLQSDASGLRPTLLIGIGGLARRVVSRVKRRMQQQVGDRSRLPIFGYVLLDTDGSSLREAPERKSRRDGEERSTDQGSRGQEELLHLPLYPPEHYRDQSRELFRWLNRKWLYGIPKSLQTEGLRPLARLALVDHAEQVLSALRQALKQITSPEAKSLTVGATGRGLRNDAPRVYVVASLTGGAGSGMLVDVAYAARQVLGELYLTDDVTGVVLFASGPAAPEKARARVNAYATLQEIGHWSKSGRDGGTGFPGTPERGLRSFPAGKPPFNDCYLLIQPDGIVGEASDGGLDELTDLVAEYLCLDLVGGGGLAGASLDSLRSHSRVPGEPLTMRSCGLSSLRFPRHLLVEQTSKLLSRQLIERWSGELTSVDQQRQQQQAREKSLQLRLSEAGLLESVHARLNDLLTAETQALHRQLIDSRANSEGGAGASPAAGNTLLTRIEAELGVGVDAEGNSPVQLAPMEKVFRAEASRLGLEYSRTLIDWLQEKVEQPESRLRGAEVALAALQQYLLEEAQKGREELARLRIARRTQRQRLQGSGGSKGSGLIPRGLRRVFQESSTGDRHLWNFFCLRLEELLQECVVSTLTEVQTRLGSWGQELVHARHRLNEMIQAIAGSTPSAASSLPTTSLASSVELWPFGANDLAAAIKALQTRLPADWHRRLDRTIQVEVLDVGGGLWAMLTGQVDGARVSLASSPASQAFWDMVCREGAIGQELQQALMSRARVLVEAALKDIDLIALLLERYGEGDELRQALQQCAEAARALSPALHSVLVPWEQLIVVLPEGPEAADLREYVLNTLVDLPLTHLEFGDAFQVILEGARFSVQEFASRLVGPDEEVIELARQLITRQDVTWGALE